MVKKECSLETTTDNKTYTLCQHRREGICCMNCVNRHRRGYFWKRSGSSTTRKRDKLPNWKLVSKNRKQWMDKRLKFKTYGVNTRYECIEITW